jgi:hypothetical protein
MKVLFLDFDGVLNSVDFHKAQHAAGVNLPWPECHLDPAPVKVLNDILEKSGAVVVVSSSWRIGGHPPSRTVWLQQTLDNGGFKGRVIDVTPVLGGKRGNEIQYWLDRHPDVTHFVILDDDTDMEHLYDKLVHIDYEHGLTQSYVESILKHLEG